MKPTPWTLRAVRIDDAPAIAHHRYHRGEPPSDIEAYSTWVQSRIAARAYIGFVAEADCRVIAGAGAVVLDWGPSRGDLSLTRARLANVFTDAPWRRRGLARALVEQVLAVSAERGVRTFNLAATVEAQPLYRSLGFESYPAEMILRR